MKFIKVLHIANEQTFSEEQSREVISVLETIDEQLGVLEDVFSEVE